MLLKAEGATDVKLVADGKTAYEGSMAKGAARLVSAKGIVQVTSSNPGALKVTFTNSAVTGYDFGVLGGDAGRTVEFTKTTSIAK